MTTPNKPRNPNFDIAIEQLNEASDYDWKREPAQFDMNRIAYAQVHATLANARALEEIRAVLVKFVPGNLPPVALSEADRAFLNSKSITEETANRPLSPVPGDVPLNKQAAKYLKSFYSREEVTDLLTDLKDRIADKLRRVSEEVASYGDTRDNDYQHAATLASETPIV